MTPETKWKSTAIVLGAALVVVVCMGQAQPVNATKVYMGMAVVPAANIQHSPHIIYRMRCDGVVECKALEPEILGAYCQGQVPAMSETGWHVLNQERCR